jgi:hypothetical protein
MQTVFRRECLCDREEAGQYQKRAAGVRESRVRDDGEDGVDYPTLKSLLKVGFNCRVLLKDVKV